MWDWRGLPDLSGTNWGARLSPPTCNDRPRRAARADRQPLLGRLRRRLVPHRHLVVARRHALDGERARAVGLRVIRRVDDEDEAQHRRVDVAQDLDDARALEGLLVGRPLLVQAGVEVVRLRQREDVVEDRVLVAEADLGADRHDQHVRDERLVALGDDLAVRRRRARRLAADALEPDDRAARPLRAAARDGAADRHRRRRRGARGVPAGERRAPAGSPAGARARQRRRRPPWSACRPRANAPPSRADGSPSRSRDRGRGRAAAPPTCPPRSRSRRCPRPACRPRAG